MRIAVVAHVRQPIAEPFMGGMEAHSWHLAEGLAKRGHEVTLFASGDSDPRFAISPILDVHYERRFPLAEHKGQPELIAHVDRGFAAACGELTRERFDVVHNNSLHRFPLAHAKNVRMPTVTSLHVPPFPGIEWFVRDALSPWHRVTVPSECQRAIWFKGHALNEVAVVPNGIGLDRWPYSALGDGRAIWCGRIAANKGPHFAIDAAREAGVLLTLYGVVEEKAYFESEVAPRLGSGICYGGHLDGSRLSQAMRASSALIFTPCWDEPFGLVAIEAMASGLPVASFERGAAREVIGDAAGRFAPPGDATALSQCLREAFGIDRRIPRSRVERLFSASTMLDNYERLYGLAIAGSMQ